MSDSEDPIDPLEEVDEEGDDLFGDEADEGDEPTTSKTRVLDDDDLASDLDEDTDARYRYDDDSQQQPEVRDRVVMAVHTYRHRIPKPKDDTVSPKLLRGDTGLCR